MFSSTKCYSCKEVINEMDEIKCLEKVIITERKKRAKPKLTKPFNWNGKKKFSIFHLFFTLLLFFLSKIHLIRFIFLPASTY